MAESGNVILVKMLDRLFAGVMSGPNLNCRPHSSRQRIDWTQLAKLQSTSPTELLKKLISTHRKMEVTACATQPASLPKPFPKSSDSKRRRDAKSTSADVARSSVERDALDEPLDESVTAKDSGPSVSPEEQKLRDAWTTQQSLLTKLRGLAEDAKDYEQDTGVHALHVGFPLLSLPPGTATSLKGVGGSAKRILAPIAFIPVTLTVRAGHQPTVVVEAMYDGADFVVPNEALFAWLERQTGKKLMPEVVESSGAETAASESPNLETTTSEPPSTGAENLASAAAGSDEQSPSPTNEEPNNENNESVASPLPSSAPSRLPQVASRSPVPHDPWDELTDLVRRVAEGVQISALSLTDDAIHDLQSAPRSDDENPKAEIIPSAVLGLFPMNNQGLLRDMQAMVASEQLDGPVMSFVSANIRIDDLPVAAETSSAEAAPSDELNDDPSAESSGAAESGVHRLSDLFGTKDAASPRRRRDVSTERMVTMTDPCQARAVRLARECRGLVIHGPPGTGKSQTITNIIGDHLARGERVLLVCDKRTALDVVAQRLQHLGLGDLCALIHDPQRDQRDLYRQVREQLENLTSTSVDSQALRQLNKVDGELKKALDALEEARSLVMDRDPQRGVSLHERMGDWLEAALPSLITKIRQSKDDRQVDNSSSGEADASKSADGAESPTASPKPRQKRKKAAAKESPPHEPVTVAMYDEFDAEIRRVIERANDVGFAGSPWRGITDVGIDDFLLRPIHEVPEGIEELIRLSEDADQLADDRIPPFVCPPVSGIPEAADSDVGALSFEQQAAAREQLAEQLKRCAEFVDAEPIKRWAKASRKKLEEAGYLLDSIEPAAAELDRPLDPELRLRLAIVPPLAELIAEQNAIGDYLVVSRTWRRWFAFRTRQRATAVLRKYGLTSEVPAAERLSSFLQGLIARCAVESAVSAVKKPQQRGTGHFDDERLAEDLADARALISALLTTLIHPALIALKDCVRSALLEGTESVIEGLRASRERAEVLTEFSGALTEMRLFKKEWTGRVIERLCRNDSLTLELEQLRDELSNLEAVVRVESSLAEMPVALARVVSESLLETDSGPVDPDESELTSNRALFAIRERVFSEDIQQWISSNRRLQVIDGTQLSTHLKDAFQLENRKHKHVCSSILAHWVGRQRERLLASTGSRLSSLGADLRRRLTIRGERALRLRQMLAVGSRIDGGDPMFDLRPVWMASPETVAQIFPREPLFDVVVFDEASQCRLEEALPVLTRAKRVVIAGDPKQLPPTRFFESASVANNDAPEIESDQQLFEVQQSNVEDLLSAALLLDIQQSYLDVHYRSRNSDLIEFSNEQFYGSRLQAVPGHPRNRVRFSPIRLYSANGVYRERMNVAEADCVCQIVADLLKRSTPPTIGIACFNVTQRDLILDKLAEAAALDDDFASRLAVARSRQGKGAFEGLFVKNLENVQGDERDHIIISTTYGPDEEGRFYRRFGPLGQVGGGRRLNVLITRAREEVHLVTSIPSELYRNLPDIPSGQQPGGGWLLFAYLAYAEQLSDRYSEWLEASRDETDVQQEVGRSVNMAGSRSPSRFAENLAYLLAQAHDVGSDVHWGNDGFCVDLALHHPTRPEDRTLGLICDLSRYSNSEDPVEWDVFRTAILAGQNWNLRRIWSPQVFRDLEKQLEHAVREAARLADQDPDPDCIQVRRE